MDIKGIHLAWIVVSDIEAAVKFYTETVGLTLMEFSKEYGWAKAFRKRWCAPWYRTI